MLLPQTISPIKLHKTLLSGIAGTLSQVFNEGKYADKVLEKIFKQNKQWGSRDRKFVAESVYDIVRYYRLLSHLASSKNNFWFITPVYLVLKGYELPDWPEFKHVNPKAIKVEYDKIKEDFKLAESYPDELNELCERELGSEKWQTEAKAMNEQAPVVLRTNTLKTNKEELRNLLLKDNIETDEVQGAEDALVLRKRQNIFNNTHFKNGLFEIQDAGSQLIGKFLDVKPKQTVIDACAGAGGKSLHLSAMMQNKGKLLSMDVTQWKLDELMKRAKRSGASNIETRLIEGKKTIDRYIDKADIVLLDVPCSGTGVIKRNPDTKWKLNENELNRTRELQQEILSNYSKMVKPGGELVYSTCSILPSENQEQVKTFLNKNPDFIFVEERSIYPSQGFDGFYMCKLKKKLMKRKNLIIKIVTITFISFLLGSCKKGELDPKISFRSRLARLEGNWNMTSGHTSITYYEKGAAPNNYNFEFNQGQGLLYQSGSLDVYIIDYSLNMNFKKDGKFSVTENIGGSLFKATGTWDFNSGVGKSKKKEEITIVLDQVTAGYSDAHFFNKFGTEFTYRLVGLRNDELVIESNCKPYITYDGEKTLFTSNLKFKQ